MKKTCPIACNKCITFDCTILKIQSMVGHDLLTLMHAPLKNYHSAKTDGIVRELGLVTIIQFIIS